MERDRQASLIPPILNPNLGGALGVAGHERQLGADRLLAEGCSVVAQTPPHGHSQVTPVAPHHPAARRRGAVVVVVVGRRDSQGLAHVSHDIVECSRVVVVVVVVIVVVTRGGVR